MTTPSTPAPHSPTSQSGTIGLIGCGLMGHGIAKNLCLAGHALTVLEHPGNRPCDDLVALGVRMSNDLQTVCHGQDAVFLVLPGSPEVDAVVRADSGLLTHVTPGTLIIDATTAEPLETLKIAAAIRAQGCAYVDAPMTRTPKEAETGRLNVLMGGSDSDVARAKLYIQAYAEHISHGGPVGAGHRLKLLHNFVSISQAVVIAEAIAAADQGGVDVTVLCDVLANGGAGGAALERLRPYGERQDASHFQFAVRNAAKDLLYYTRQVQAQGTQSSTAQTVHRILAEVSQNPEHAGAVIPQLIDIFKAQKTSP